LALPHNQLGLLDLQATRPRKQKAIPRRYLARSAYAEGAKQLGVLYGQLGKGAEAERLFRVAQKTILTMVRLANLGMILASESRFGGRPGTFQRDSNGTKNTAPSAHTGWCWCV